MPHPNAVHNLLRDFRKEYPDWGSTPNPETLLLYKLTRTVSGSTPTGSSSPPTSSGSIASSVSITGSTGQTILTDSEGRLVVANMANLLGRIPTLVEGRIPVGVAFPTNQQVTVSNQLTGVATQATLVNILTKLDNLSVTLPFPAVQRVFVDNLSTDAASEQTLQEILEALPLTVNGRLPVSLETSSFSVNNQIQGYSTESTLQALLNKTPTLTGVQQSLSEILGRLPELEQGKLPVAFTAQANITGFSTETTLSSLLEKTVAPVEGKLPVSLTFPTNQQVTISNQLDISALGKDATLANILNKLPPTVDGKVPVALTFPTNQTVTVSNQPATLDISGLGKDSTLASVLGRLPALVDGKTQVNFPANQAVTVSNQLDVSALSKDATLTSILNKLPTLTNGKAQVVLDFPTNQTVTVSNQPTPLDISALSKDSTLASILVKLPSLVNGKTQVDFPQNQTVTVSNPLDVSALGKDTTLTSILNRMPVAPSLGDSPLWTVARTKKVEGLDSFAMTFLGRRLATFATGFTDIAEFELQTVGNNLRSPTLTGAHTVEIISSNAADSATGTGIRTVEVMYLDEGFNFRATSVTLNGTTAVQVQKDGVAIKPTCILKMQTTSHGTSAGAVGTVTLRTPAGTLQAAVTPVDQISVGFTSSFSARTCVPEGYLGYVIDVTGAGITANHDFHLLATVAQSDKRLLDGVFSSLDFFTANAGTIPVNRDENFYELPSRCRVRLASRASATTASATGSFTVVFVKKPV